MKEKYSDQAIQTELSVLKPVPPRQALAAAQGKERFLRQAATLRNANGAKIQKRYIPGYLPAPRKQPNLAFQGLMAAIITIVIFFSGTGLTVYASQGSLPNQALYQVKMISEDAMLILAGSPLRQIALSMEYADRRVEEITALITMGGQVPEGLIDRLQNELNVAITLSASLDNSQMQQQLEKIHLRIQTQIQNINALTENNSTETPLLLQVRARIQEQLRLCELGQSDPEGLRLQIQYRQQLQNGWELTITPAHQGQQAFQSTGTNQGDENGLGAGSITPSGTPSKGCGCDDSVNPGGQIEGTPQSGDKSGNKP